MREEEGHLDDNVNTTKKGRRRELICFTKIARIAICKLNGNRRHPLAYEDSSEFS